MPPVKGFQKKTEDQIKQIKTELKETDEQMLKRLQAKVEANKLIKVAPKRRELTPEEIFPILKQTHLIGLFASLIDLEFHNRIFDAKFKNPSTTLHAARIKESAEQIRLDLSYQFKVKDLDNFSYAHTYEMWRACDHFGEMSTDELRAYNDGIEQLKKEGKLGHGD